MILIIGPLWFFVIWVWLPAYFDREYDFSWFWITLSGFIATVVIFVLSVGLAISIGLFLPKEWALTENVRLVDLGKPFAAKDGCFLASGRIDGKKYFFFSTTGENYRSVKAKKAKIFEPERQDQTCRFRAYFRRFNHPAFNWVAICLPFQRYEFIIPGQGLRENFVLSE